MIAYVGQTRSPKLIAELARLGVGECTVTGEMNPRRSPWFHDNGAFRDSIAKRPFRLDRWTRDVMRVHNTAFARAPAFAPPDFFVVPDIVAGGRASLAFSAEWRFLFDDADRPYLAVQNGMETSEVADVLVAERYAGIFVGGDTDWKLETGAAWVELAHRLGLKCHVGRCGPPDRVAWAQAIGADSIDSSLPLMHEEHLRAFLQALGLW
jgi:hypothetical protein